MHYLLKDAVVRDPDVKGPASSVKLPGRFEHIRTPFSRNFLLSRVHSHDHAVSLFLLRHPRFFIKPRLGDFLSLRLPKAHFTLQKLLVTFPADASRNRVILPSAKFVAAFITLARTFSRKILFSAL